MNSKIFTVSILLLSLLVLALMWGCTDKYEPAPSKFASGEESGCTSCHLDKSLLEQVAEPLPEPSEPAGEG